MSAAKHAFRREDRLPVVIPARCRTRSGFADRLMIRDISREGCRVESLAITVQVGDPVVVTPAMLEGLCGTVRWVSGHSAGIEFATPLYGPVVDHLYREYRTFLPEPGLPENRRFQMAA
jgi:PilZ domain